MTLSDLEWPFQASRAVSAVAELLVIISQSIWRSQPEYQAFEIICKLHYT